MLMLRFAFAHIGNSKNTGYDSMNCNYANLKFLVFRAKILRITPKVFGSALILFFISSSLLAQLCSIQGKVLTESETEGSFAVIGCTSLKTGQTYGTTCDENGNFTLKVHSGKYQLSCHLIGYFDFEQSFEIGHGRIKTFSIILKENPSELRAIEIYSDKKDLAKEVIRNAIEARVRNAGKDLTVAYDSYTKTSILRHMPDTSEFGMDSTYLAIKERDRPKRNYQKHLIESVSEIQFQPGKNFKQRITASKDFSPNPPRSGGGTSISLEYGETDILPQQYVGDNNYILRTYTGYQELSLYNRLLDLPALTEKKILSPIGEGALLSYRYDLDAILFDDTVKIFVIRFSPLFPGETLLTGKIHIRNDSWAITEAAFDLPSHALFFFRGLTCQQIYSQEQTSGTYHISALDIQYNIREGQQEIKAQIIVRNTNIRLETEPLKFDDETITYSDNAFDRDSIFWTTTRSAPFNELEKNYASYCDSLQLHFSSPEYFAEKDSSYNKIKFMDFILYGVGFRNHFKKQEIFINPLIMQINPVGIGGYRHRLGGMYQKEYANDFLLETDGMVDYGFRNKDIRGKIGAGLTYYPKKFVRTYLRCGDYYDMINNYASLGSVFSRSNYVRTQMISVAQRLEIINGLFAELTFEFSDQKPISNLRQDQWSQQLFGDINAPIEFDRYIKSELRLDVKYRFRQKYMIRKNKKILLGSAYPEINAVYRKGIPGLFRSEIDFDYLEVGIRHEKELGRLGNMEWSILGGSFINRTNLRILEHKYFRGSDVLFFSDPLRSFQLLGPTLSTPNAYFRGNYFHHFNGILFNKIPLLHKLKLTEAAGAAFLAIPDQNFFHSEFYAGIERVIRIREEIFRLGVYACTIGSTLKASRLEFKLGFNFFDSFHKKWNY
jgi:hypothetical protein